MVEVEKEKEEGARREKMDARRKPRAREKRENAMVWMIMVNPAVAWCERDERSVRGRGREATTWQMPALPPRTSCTPDRS